MNGGGPFLTRRLSLQVQRLLVLTALVVVVGFPLLLLRGVDHSREFEPEARGKFRQHEVELPRRAAIQPVRVRESNMNSFLPLNAPKRISAAVRIDDIMSQCPERQILPQSLASLLGASQDQHCSQPLTFDDLLCKLECDIQEPELEDSFRAMGTSTYTIEYLYELCKKEDITVLVWIYQGNPRYMPCGGRDRVQSHKLFESTRTIISALSCMSEVPDVFFGIDTRDWAAPSSSPAVPGWLQPLPGVARYSGSSAHPGILLPTDAYIRATTHCNVEDNGNLRRALRVCKSLDVNYVYRDRNWVDRIDLIFWRGSSTGVPLQPLVYEYLPRPALIKGFFQEPGFDVGFTGGKPPHHVPGYGDFFTSHTKKAVRSHEYCLYKYILHCDGHTASWGLSQKLTTKSAVIWIDSQFHYREFYYAHLHPWEHYIPADSDLSNLREIRDWAFTPTGDQAAYDIAQRADQLFQKRLRPGATYCYLARLLASLTLAQRVAPTPLALKKAEIPLEDFRDFEEFTTLTRI